MIAYGIIKADKHLGDPTTNIFVTIECCGFILQQLYCKLLECVCILACFLGMATFLNVSFETTNFASILY